MNIGLTGGIATGKSTVSSMLVRKGALLVDADVIAREVMLPGHPVLAEVAAHFGQDILQTDGQLDRKKLGEIVFNDPKERLALNGITHPAIRREIRRQMEAYEKSNPEQLVVVDIPLLYESELQSLFHKVMVVYVPRKTQLQRLMERDRLTEEQAKARLDSQMDIEQKKRMADYVIDNSGSMAETERQLDELWPRITRP
ncbi:dephospho-CoA kinase [Paenibacillus sp. DMB20]|uniref:dephospho-CoA kinase n=1 Tax=Paenibacillus sp. DMB20 TaxID=1642570 RepID=UPI000627C035|nr:dephospho-CoA kinase [Paenibacillus sp. DMB20]KKO52877.1 dephospho-CoA kinase [Paenibacillus sp. DMB20]KKO53757.1 dephospho-CoA kinase [Paenibacillus sp. DMB20]